MVLGVSWVDAATGRSGYGAVHTPDARGAVIPAGSRRAFLGVPLPATAWPSAATGPSSPRTPSSPTGTGPRPWGGTADSRTASAWTAAGRTPAGGCRKTAVRVFRTVSGQADDTDPSSATGRARTLSSSAGTTDSPWLSGSTTARAAGSVTRFRTSSSFADRPLLAVMVPLPVAIGGKKEDSWVPNERR